jgi:6,7-dimethyl-8-ribityllumazine synthase
MASTEERDGGLTPPTFHRPPRVLIGVAPYYRDIADQLLAGATAALKQARAEVDVVEVPGALEVPTAIAIAAESDRYEGYVALGCVIRGETTHYDTVCNDSSRGLALLGVERRLAIGNGILTVENRAQAEARANPEDMNKGGGAAEAALHLIGLRRNLQRRTPAFRPGSENIILAGDPPPADTA